MSLLNRGSTSSLTKPWHFMTPALQRATLGTPREPLRLGWRLETLQHSMSFVHWLPAGTSMQAV